MLDESWRKVFNARKVPIGRKDRFVVNMTTVQNIMRDAQLYNENSPFDIEKTQIATAYKTVCSKFHRTMLSFDEFKQFIIEYAKGIKKDKEIIETAISRLQKPSYNVQKTKEDPVVTRLTNPKLYGGTHVHRFEENGKGAGKSGRMDIAKDTTGYVQGYTNKGMYDKPIKTRLSMSSRKDASYYNQTDDSEINYLKAPSNFMRAKNNEHLFDQSFTKLSTNIKFADQNEIQGRYGRIGLTSPKEQMNERK